MDSNGGGGWPFSGVPIGFGVGIAIRPEILDRYEKLTEAEKEKMLARSRELKTREEMEAFLNSLE